MTHVYLDALFSDVVPKRCLVAHRLACVVLARGLPFRGERRLRDVDEMALACSEACANAIEHAYSPPAGRVELEGQVLAPLIFRRTVHVNPLVVVLSILFFGELAPEGAEA